MRIANANAEVRTKPLFILHSHSNSQFLIGRKRAGGEAGPSFYSK
jgi:hypothetical protein